MIRAAYRFLGAASIYVLAVALLVAGGVALAFRIPSLAWVALIIALAAVVV